MSCTSTPATGALYFPITVLAGVADLTVSTAGEIQADASDKTEAFARNARMLNKDLTFDETEKHTQRESPSEYDYLSNIQLQPRRDSAETVNQQKNDMEPVSSIRLQKGESFSTPIPVHKKLTVVVENKDSNELRFMCTGKQFVLQQGEMVMLHFR
jgi:putative lipoprotein